MTRLMDRRHILKSLALAPFAAALPNALLAEQAGLITGNVCLIARQTTEGPFYLDPAMLRQDITEGVQGQPMRLRMQVVTSDCTPIEGARVDVWHCDAQGAYSGVGADAGKTFFRGSQMTDPQGIVTFQTIYPGWYPGRAIHIHYKVLLNERDVLTSQIFFDEAVTNRILGDNPIYAVRGGPDVPITMDRIARQSGDGAVSAIEVIDEMLTSSLVIGVADPSKA
jgi:protocatechuate 3,4-dioxygenase beta subunit